MSNRNKQTPYHVRKPRAGRGSETTIFPEAQLPRSRKQRPTDLKIPVPPVQSWVNTVPLVVIPKPLWERIIANLEAARDAATHVIRTCEADLEAGKSPSPFQKSCPNEVIAVCYGSMNFVGELHKLLAELKTSTVEAQYTPDPKG